MTLSELKPFLKQDYRSDRDSLVKDFYVPCLSRSVCYDRAVGYFTSSSLRLAARGLVRFVSRDGSRMRLVASPCLDDDDIAAIRAKVDEERTKHLHDLITNSFYDAVTEVQARHLEFMSWMVQEGKLQIKLAYRPTHKGIFHEKIGVFTDHVGAGVAFTGSANETVGGLQTNFESIDVYTQWNDPVRVASKIENFEHLWAGKDTNLKVIDFTDATIELLSRYRRADRFDPQRFADIDFDDFEEKTLVEDTSSLSSVGMIVNPAGFVPRPYQEEALNAWVSSHGSGMFEMATGTGKTLTAMMCVSRAQEKNEKLVIVVAAPFKHLCRQWAKDVRNFGIEPIACYESKSDWSIKLRAARIEQDSVQQGSVFICVTNSTLIDPDFCNILKEFSCPLFFIGDEVHNMGADETNLALPDFAQLRLGLSATPVRAGDEEGTARVLAYFGNIVFQFSLERAIQEKYLTPYEYHPVFVQLTKVEADEYTRLTKEYAKYASSKEPSYRRIAEQKLFERARVVGSAYNKLDALSRLILSNGMRKALVYCSDGSMLEPSGEIAGRHIDCVVRMLRSDHSGVRVNKFTFMDDTDQRDRMIAEMAEGAIDGLAAIKCLDEGVDVPSLEVAYILASTKNPRQSIQRRGRLLRKSPGKTKAIIYDFIIEPPSFSMGDGAEVLKWEARLFEGELARGLEFARLATNANESSNKFENLRRRYLPIS